MGNASCWSATVAAEAETGRERTQPTPARAIHRHSIQLNHREKFSGHICGRLDSPISFSHAWSAALENIQALEPTEPLSSLQAACKENQRAIHTLARTFSNKLSDPSTLPRVDVTMRC